VLSSVELGLNSFRRVVGNVANLGSKGLGSKSVNLSKRSFSGTQYTQNSVLKVDALIAQRWAYTQNSVTSGSQYQIKNNNSDSVSSSKELAVVLRTPDSYRSDMGKDPEFGKYKVRKREHCEQLLQPLEHRLTAKFLERISEDDLLELRVLFRLGEGEFNLNLANETEMAKASMTLHTHGRMTERLSRRLDKLLTELINGIQLARSYFEMRADRTAKETLDLSRTKETGNVYGAVLLTPHNNPEKVRDVLVSATSHKPINDLRDAVSNVKNTESIYTGHPCLGINIESVKAMRRTVTEPLTSDFYDSIAETLASDMSYTPNDGKVKGAKGNLARFEHEQVTSNRSISDHFEAMASVYELNMESLRRAKVTHLANPTNETLERQYLCSKLYMKAIPKKERDWSLDGDRNGLDAPNFLLSKAQQIFSFSKKMEDVLGDAFLSLSEDDKDKFCQQLKKLEQDALASISDKENVLLSYEADYDTACLLQNVQLTLSSNNTSFNKLHRTVEEFSTWKTSVIDALSENSDPMFQDKIEFVIDLVRTSLGTQARIGESDRDRILAAYETGQPLVSVDRDTLRAHKIAIDFDLVDVILDADHQGLQCTKNTEKIFRFLGEGDLPQIVSLNERERVRDNPSEKRDGLLNWAFPLVRAESTEHAKEIIDSIVKVGGVLDMEAASDTATKHSTLVGEYNVMIIQYEKKQIEAYVHLIIEALEVCCKTNLLNTGADKKWEVKQLDIPEQARVSLDWIVDVFDTPQEATAFMKESYHFLFEYGRGSSVPRTSAEKLTLLQGKILEAGPSDKMTIQPGNAPRIVNPDYAHKNAMLQSLIAVKCGPKYALTPAEYSGAIKIATAQANTFDMIVLCEKCMTIINKLNVADLTKHIKTSNRKVVVSTADTNSTQRTVTSSKDKLKAQLDKLTDTSRNRNDVLKDIEAAIKEVMAIDGGKENKQIREFIDKIDLNGLIQLIDVNPTAAITLLSEMAAIGESIQKNVKEYQDTRAISRVGFMTLVLLTIELIASTLIHPSYEKELAELVFPAHSRVVRAFSNRIAPSQRVPDLRHVAILPATARRLTVEERIELNKLILKIQEYTRVPLRLEQKWTGEAYKHEQSLGNRFSIQQGLNGGANRLLQTYDYVKKSKETLNNGLPFSAKDRDHIESIRYDFMLKDDSHFDSYVAYLSYLEGSLEKMAHRLYKEIKGTYPS
jgi:hypothetical protein